ncbi:MAG TPA: DNA polymerase IV [Bacteriovoracaceae bacterium]|nr:DNA polymerase IV [Bacteriovoracaceae bacterium]
MRKIIHLDMDAFFASVEMRDNPKLRDVPMAVGGSSDRRGVLTTANYLARKYGVKSAMPTSLAMKLCPQLIVVRTNFKKYVEASEQVFEIFHEYTPLVQSLSLDEAYLDVTDIDRCQNSATWMAQEIRKKVFEKTQLTISAGIAPNKLIAKLASDHNKPNGQFTVAPKDVDGFIRGVPVERIWGIGKVTAKKLHELGLKTCLDLQGLTRDELIFHLGKFGDALYDFCRGVDEREVETEYERKSLGTEETFEKDLNQFEEMKAHVVRMVEEVRESLNSYEDREVKNLHVKIKYHDFKQTTIERQLPFSEENFIELLEERWSQDPRPVRLLGVGVKFEEAYVPPQFSGGQLSLLTEPEQ